jgi:hypothetical protein
MSRLTVLVMVAGGCCVALASDIPPPRPVDIAAIVRQLGSEDFAAREAASRRLSTLDVDEPPAELLAALKSPNPEVRERAAKAVKALREHIALGRDRAAARHLPRGERFARLGQLDLYVASTAVSDLKPDDPRLWEPALDIGRRATERAEMKGDRQPHNCPSKFPDFATYKKLFSPRLTRVDEAFQPERTYIPEAIQAPGVTDPASGFIYTLAVSRGPVHAPKGVISTSLVLATGDVSCGDDLNNSVVVCDGDVRVGRNVNKSLVIARGKITVGGTADSSYLIAGKTVAIATPPEPVRKVANPLLQKTLDSTKVVVEEAAAKPLGYITFFELSAVGVETKADGKDVRVAAVTDGGAFATAGVRVGDVVVDVGGKKPDSPEALQRLLRDALAVGDAKVSLLRDGKPVAATVALPE